MKRAHEIGKEKRRRNNEQSKTILKQLETGKVKTKTIVRRNWRRNEKNESKKKKVDVRKQEKGDRKK